MTNQPTVPDPLAPPVSKALINFRLLWFGEGVSLLGNATSSVLLPLLAVQQLGAGPLGMGLLSAAAWLPWLIIGLPAGAWLDGWPPRRVMIIANVVGAAAVLSVPLALRLGVLSLPQLIGVALAGGSATVFFRGAYAKLLPLIVPTDRLESANAKMFGTESAMQVGGPGLAGLLWQLTGAVLGLVLDAISFVVSAACLARIRLPKVVHTSTEPRVSLRDRIGEGINFIARDRYLRVLLIIGGSSNFGLTGYAALLILYLVRELGLPAGQVGVILMIGSVGGLLGAVLAGPASRRLGTGRASTLLMMIGGPLALLVGAATDASQVWLCAAGLVGVGVAVVAGNVIRSAWRQRYVPQMIMGRVITSGQVINFGTMPLAGVVAGVLGNAIGIRETVLIMAGIHAVASLSIALTAFGRCRDLPERVSRPASHPSVPSRLRRPGD